MQRVCLTPGRSLTVGQGGRPQNRGEVYGPHVQGADQTVAGGLHRGHDERTVRGRGQRRADPALLPDAVCHRRSPVASGRPPAVLPLADQCATG